MTNKSLATRIGARIGALRKRKKLSQQGFGSAIGISRQAVSQMEAGKSCPSAESIDAIRRIWKVDVMR